MKFKQGRIIAESADEAAVKIRGKYGGGKLTIKRVGIFDGNWYEYVIKLNDK